jgi:hypothetical protein
MNSERQDGRRYESKHCCLFVAQLNVGHGLKHRAMFATVRARKHVRPPGSEARSCESMRWQKNVRSSADQARQLFGVPGSFHTDLGDGVSDLAQIIRCELEVYRADILLESM